MEQKIEQLYKPLYGYIKKRINNTLDAEDLTQEVFYKLYNSDRDKLENVKSWIYSIAKNSIIDYYRKKRLDTKEINEEFIDEEDKNEALEELSNCVSPFINQLPDELITIMKLSEIENHSQKDIAEKMNLNYETVRSKIQRGRVKLKLLISNCCSVIQGAKGSIIDFKQNNSCKGGC